MLPGPVFDIELVTTARRGRYYFVRFLYGLILLYLIWQSNPRLYHDYARAGADDGLTIQEMATMGHALFGAFVMTQAVAVLLLTPAMVAGVIADERQRKTLHYLMASRLSSGEIVLGKLAARLLHVGVFLALGLPIMSLLSLFGGVDPAEIVLVYSGTISTAFFLAALAILVSTHARRPREAISLVYILELCWLFVPSLIHWVMPSGGWFWNRLYAWIKPINDWLYFSSPFSLVYSLGAGPARSGLSEAVAWMVGLQLGYGVLFVLLAVARLRPVFRKAGEVGSPRGWVGIARRGRRILPRPDCGDDAMLWKERYVSRTSFATKVVSIVVFLIVGGLLVYTTFDLALPAFAELAVNGYGRGGDSARSTFNSYLRTVCTLLYVAWVLGVASASASGLTSEREEDTWLSLLATPLEGLEIIRAKMFGSLWGLRGFGVLLMGLWITGLAAGSIHPLGFLAVLVETVVFLWFVAALGVYLSLRSKNSGRSMTLIIAILIFVNGGYLMCCMPLQPDSTIAALGVTPMIEAVSLVTYDEISRFSAFSGSRRDQDMAWTCILGTIFYAGAALALTLSAISRFDIAADRPRREWTGGPGQEIDKFKPDDTLTVEEML